MAAFTPLASLHRGFAGNHTRPTINPDLELPYTPHVLSFNNNRKRKEPMCVDCPRAPPVAKGGDFNAPLSIALCGRIPKGEHAGTM